MVVNLPDCARHFCTIQNLSCSWCLKRQREAAVEVVVSGQAACEAEKGGGGGGVR